MDVVRGLSRRLRSRDWLVLIHEEASTLGAKAKPFNGNGWNGNGWNGNGCPGQRALPRAHADRLRKPS